MRYIIFIILLTFSLKPAFAECAMSGMQFYPEQKEISLNSMFIIQGYSMSQKTIISFRERKVYLESENGDLIELRLQEILKGQMLLTQAIFRPISELKPNTIYSLKYSDQTERETNEMKRWNSEKKESEKVYWKTNDNKSLETLDFNLNINFKKTEVIHYGCGPSANAIFTVENKPEFEIWYKAEVIEIDTNKTTVYYITEWKGKLQVGHGMCSGAFTFKRKGDYKVRFTPMNTDGNSIASTDWKKFESPFADDKNPYGF